MKGLVNFRGYRVADYWTDDNIQIDQSKQRINKYGNVSYTGYMNLNDVIKMKNDEDIDFKAIYEYCKSISEDSIKDGRNTAIAEFSENHPDNAIIHTIHIYRCTIENMKVIFNMDEYKQKDPQMIKNLDMIFTYGKYLLRFKKNTLSSIVLSYSFNDDNGNLNILTFTFNDDNLNTNVPSCDISISSLLTNANGSEKDDSSDSSDNGLMIRDEYGITVLTEKFFKHAFDKKLYSVENNIIILKNIFSYNTFVASTFYDEACKNDPDGVLDGFSEEDYKNPLVLGRKMFNYVVDGILRYWYDMSNDNGELYDGCGCYAKMAADTDRQEIISSIFFNNTENVCILYNCNSRGFELIAKDIKDIDKVTISESIIEGIYKYTVHILEYFTEYSKLWNNTIGSVNETSVVFVSDEEDGFSIGIVGDIDKNNATMIETLSLSLKRPMYDHMLRHQEDMKKESSTIVHDNVPQIIDGIGLFGVDLSNISSMQYNITNNVLAYALNNIIGLIPDKDYNSIVDILSIIPFYIYLSRGKIFYNKSGKFTFLDIKDAGYEDDIDKLKSDLKSFNRLKKFDKCGIDNMPDEVIYKLFDISREVLSYIINHIIDTGNNAVWINHDIMGELEYVFGVHFVVRDDNENITKDILHYVTITNVLSSDTIEVRYAEKNIK